jgi:sigma-B regulation protein RsbU (phosphoserine phosphatase)
MPTSPGDLPGILRVDAVSLALGVLLVVAGLLTLVVWATARRVGTPGDGAHRGRRPTILADRAASLLLLGIFAFLYGLRLLARTTTFRLFFDVPAAAWEHLTAAITYTVPLPMLLFMRAVTPVGRRFTTLASVGLVVFATYAIASDIILRRPCSAEVPNNLIAVTLIVALWALFFRLGVTPSRELRTLRVGVLAWSLTAVADNLRGMKVLAFPGPELEPFGFIVLVACLGALAAWRLLGDARRLVVIDRELSIARQIQFSILPQAMPRVPRTSLAARYRPMTAVAGDVYDFLEIDGQRLGVLVADVSGHGVPAALIASMVKVALAAQHERADRPAAVLAGMNDALCGRLGGQFVTAAYLFLDGASGLIRYAAAGHPPMLRLARRRSLEIRELEKNGFALGFVQATNYEELEQPLDAGDRLLLYTDGLVEAANAAEDLFGLERVKGALAAGASLPADAAADALLHTMDAWSGQPASDDLTIVLVDWDTRTL